MRGGVGALRSPAYIFVWCAVRLQITSAARTGPLMCCEHEHEPSTSMSRVRAEHRFKISG